MDHMQILIYGFNKKHKSKNPINRKANECCQYTVTVALNHNEIRKHSERITKIINNITGQE